MERVLSGTPVPHIAGSRAVGSSLETAVPATSLPNHVAVADQGTSGAGRRVGEAERCSERSPPRAHV